MASSRDLHPRRQMAERGPRQPDFLCIGAQRAATTWLYHNLKAHPQVWMPPYKELHYFDLPQGTSTLRLWYRRPNSFRRQIANNLGGALRAGDLTSLGWYRRFLLGRRSPEWYLSLFVRAGDRLTGDMTPAYAALAAPRVKEITKWLPEVKILFILRNPIERAWSQLNMKSWNLRALPGNRLPLSVARSLLNSRAIELRSDYLSTLAAWESCIPKERLFIDYYERIQETPIEFLDRLGRFLGLAVALDAGPATVSRYNAYEKPPVPQELRSELARRYLPQIQVLHRRFQNPYTAGWLAYAEQHAA